MTCLELRKRRHAKHSYFCGRTLCAISLAACIACRMRHDPSTVDITDHPCCVPGGGASFDIDAIKRVRDDPPAATRPYK